MRKNIAWTRSINSNKSFSRCKAKTIRKHYDGLEIYVYLCALAWNRIWAFFHIFVRNIMDPEILWNFINSFFLFFLVHFYDKFMIFVYTLGDWIKFTAWKTRRMCHVEAPNLLLYPYAIYWIYYPHRCSSSLLF